jgi:hypothetical protein
MQSIHPLIDSIHVEEFKVVELADEFERRKREYRR